MNGGGWFDGIAGGGGLVTVVGTVATVRHAVAHGLPVHRVEGRLLRTDPIQRYWGLNIIYKFFHGYISITKYNGYKNYYKRA